MQEAGADRAILIPPSWEGDSSEFSLEAVAKYPAQVCGHGADPINKPEGRARDDRDLEGPARHAWRAPTFHHAWDQD
jgi:hypothetical protein